MICYLHTEGAGCARHREWQKHYGHFTSFVLARLVTCEMIHGRSSRSKVSVSWHVCFAIHLLWEGYPPLTLFRLKDLQLIIALHLFGRPYYLRVNLLHWIYLHCRGIRMADIKDFYFFGSNKFSPADCPLDFYL
jgi:hypothetical protein